jgi:hypothetical protein
MFARFGGFESVSGKGPVSLLSDKSRLSSAEAVVQVFGILPCKPLFESFTVSESII